jgi:glycosyltransferase involved in cell wall biosynthesis
MFTVSFGEEYLDKLKAQITKLGIQENVIWLGFLSYEEMAEHYNVADIIVSVPSSDSSPKSVYEAMFCGKPVVVTDLEWSHELLGDCDCLSRVSVRDVSQLSKSIANIIGDDVTAARLSSNALLNAHKYFDYEKNMKQMEKIMVDAQEEYVN